MDKFEIHHPFLADDSFGPHPPRTPRTPISEHSNFTFNPKQPLSPLDIPTPLKGKFKWDPDMRLFELEEQSCNSEDKEERTIKKEIVFQKEEEEQSKMDIDRSKKSAGLIKKAPKEKVNGKGGVKGRRKGKPKEEFQTNLDSFIKANHPHQQHS